MSLPFRAHVGDVPVTVHMADFTTGTPSCYGTSPIKGRIVRIRAVPQGDTTGASTLTAKINGTAITGGTILLSQTGGTATVTDLATIKDTTVNVLENDKVSFTTDGNSSDGTVACNVSFTVRPVRL